MRRIKQLSAALVGIASVLMAVSAIAGASEITVLPAPSEASPVRFTYKASKPLWESVGGKKVECAETTGIGSLTSARLGTLEVKAVGCTALGVKCTGLANSTPGELTFLAEVHLRHLLSASEGITLAILLGHIHSACAGILYLGLGCYASMDLLTKEGGESIVEKLVHSIFANFLQKKGIQEPASILNDKDEADEQCILLLQQEAGMYEQAALCPPGTMEGFEKGGSSVTLLVH